MVAAVSEAWEGVTVAADWAGRSYEGIYYSTDSGVTWSLYWPIAVTVAPTPK